MKYTDDQLVAGILNALKAGDMSALEVMLFLLAGQNPRRAQEVLSTMEYGVLLAREDV